MPARRSVRLSVRASSPHPPALPAVTFLRCRLRALTWAPRPTLRPAPRRTGSCIQLGWTRCHGAVGLSKRRGQRFTGVEGGSGSVKVCGAELSIPGSAQGTSPTVSLPLVSQTCAAAVPEVCAVGCLTQPRQAAGPPLLSETALALGPALPSRSVLSSCVWQGPWTSRTCSHPAFCHKCACSNHHPDCTSNLHPSTASAPHLSPSPLWIPTVPNLRHWLAPPFVVLWLVLSAWSAFKVLAPPSLNHPGASTEPKIYPVCLTPPSALNPVGAHLSVHSWGGPQVGGDAVKIIGGHCSPQPLRGAA
ncbi:uncharacterized protein LOC130848783 [Hippopotamus amphibius kiboko]|uniref:uncharacterized protein LOC130848783 n=1 Tax=Hippopotamus amphibius kiboko TaxID=575201 RepID=UPI002592016C|nr:uncharacterized protein LOC130848783 [Hippopotamus amphibius kiboko]